MARFFRKGSGQRFEPPRDNIADLRGQRALDLAKRWTLDLAQLLHGAEVGSTVRRSGKPYVLDLSYLAPQARSAMLDSMRPFLEKGYRAKAQFDEGVDVDLEGLEEGGMATAAFELHSRSVTVDAYGRRFPADDERFDVTLFLDPKLETILTVSMVRTAGGVAGRND